MSYVTGRATRVAVERVALAAQLGEEDLELLVRHEPRLVRRVGEHVAVVRRWYASGTCESWHSQPASFIASTNCAPPCRPSPASGATCTKQPPGATTASTTRFRCCRDTTYT